MHRQRWRARFRELVALSLITAAGLAFGGLALPALLRHAEDPLASAWRAVAANPLDARAWLALGEAQAALDQHGAAEESYRAALRLGGLDPEAAGRLGFLLYGLGRSSEALELLAQARSGGVALPLLDYTIQRIEAEREAQADPLTGGAVTGGREPASSPAAPEGPCRLQLARVHGGAGPLLAPVRFGEQSARLVVDTGASLTVLTLSLAERLDLTLDVEHPIQVLTAVGRTAFPTALVPALELAGRTASDVRVAVCADCGSASSDGLLGLDLQAAWRLRVDAEAGTVSFGDCP